MKTLVLLAFSVLLMGMGYMNLKQESYEHLWYNRMGFGPDTVEVVVVRMYSPVTGVLSEARNQESIRWERRGYVPLATRTALSHAPSSEGTQVIRQKWVRPRVTSRNQ